MDMHAGTVSFGDGGKRATFCSQFFPSATQVAERVWTARYFIQTAVTAS